MKSIGIGVIALFLFIGTIGVNVYSNFCEEEGVKVTYFVPDQDFCCDERGATEDDECTDNCCPTQGNENDGCCDTSLELVKVKLDYLNQWVAKAILIAPSEITPVWSIETELVSVERKASSGTDPPPKLRRDILIDFQQWLI